MSYKLTGTVKQVGDVEQISDKFKKRTLVVTDNSTMYPQHVTFEATQDKTDMLNTISVGDEVEVSFNLKGREYIDKNTGEVKHFNTIEAWRVEALTSAPVAAPVASAGSDMLMEEPPF
jgi:hypothetical protein